VLNYALCTGSAGVSTSAFPLKPTAPRAPAGGSGRATSLEYLLTGFQQNPSVTL
jgi:hypothetical protein